MPDRWSRLGSLFEAAVELAPDAQASFIARECADDAPLADELRALLAADQSGASEGFLQSVVGAAAVSFARDADGAAASPATAGQRIGAWRIVRPIGEGGMGSVFLAARADGAYEAEVALKLVRGGIAGPMLAKRFLAERQILATLVHPGIARLLDGGTTDDGTPFLVMEHIDGVPITAWCERQGLTVAERCRLLVAVCDAVGHAHRQLVVHRDIKPSNILVTAAGAPTLLDFGIATIADVMDAEGGERTTMALQLMTPAYASPEQVRGARATVASDVYALGVLGYELLAGCLPLETRGLAPTELERRVTHDVPPPASAVAPVARQRALRGDVDAILSRALRKEPGERYPSVEALAEDIGRHLDGHPIAARRGDRAYRAGRFVRRHVGAVSATLVVMVLLAGFGISTLIQSRSIRSERDRARAVSDFLVRVFAVSDPNEAQGDTITARALLDSGAVRLHRELADEPETRALLALTMARAYRNLGLSEQSRPLIDSSLAIRRRVLPPGHVELAEAIDEQAQQSYAEGDYEGALPLYEEAIAIFGAVRRGDSQPLADALSGYASALDALRRLPQADSLARRALAMNRRLHRSPSTEIGLSHTNLAAILRHAGELAQALPHNESAIAELRGATGANPLDLANALNHLGSTLRGLQRDADALAVIEEAIAIQERVHGRPHAETAASLGNLAGTLQQLGRFDESEAVRRRSLAMLGSLVGREHPYYAGTMQSLAAVLHSGGKLVESERVYRESLLLHRRAYPAGHPSIAFPLTGLGRLLLAERRPAQALPFLREAYDIRRTGLAEGNWQIAASGIELGKNLTQLRRYREAEPILVEAVQLLTAAFGAEDSRTGQAREALAVLADAVGDKPRAIELRAPPPSD